VRSFSHDEEIQQLAATHYRALPLSSGLQMQPETNTLSTPTCGGSPSLVSDVPSDLSAHVIDLTKQLNSLQAHIATLEHQLILLREQLQKEQQWSMHQGEETSPRPW
jgi:hypothetical protein